MRNENFPSPWQIRRLFDDVGLPKDPAPYPLPDSVVLADDAFDPPTSLSTLSQPPRLWRRRLQGTLAGLAGPCAVVDPGCAFRFAPLANQLKVKGILPRFLPLPIFEPWPAMPMSFNLVRDVCTAREAESGDSDRSESGNMPSFGAVRRSASVWHVDLSNDVPWGLGSRREAFSFTCGVFLAAAAPWNASVSLVGSAGRSQLAGLVVDACQALVSDGAPLKRLEQRYASAVAWAINPILIHLLERIRPAHHYAMPTEQNLRTGLHPNGLGDPMDIQLLFALARSAPAVTAPLAAWGDVPPAAWEAERRQLVPWLGTGRYPSGAVSRGEVEWRFQRQLPYVFFGDDGVPSLTALGRALLEMLPAACDDPDLPLRWRGGIDGTFRKDCLGEAEDWLEDTFAAVARKAQSAGVVLRAPDNAGAAA